MSTTIHVDSDGNPTTPDGCCPRTLPLRCRECGVVVGEADVYGCGAHTTMRAKMDYSLHDQTCPVGDALRACAPDGMLFAIADADE